MSVNDKFMFKSFMDFCGSFSDKEVWHDISYPGIKRNKYEVSNFGNVRNIKTKKIMAKREHGGYVISQLMGEDNKNHQYQTHRIVAYEFVEGFDNGLVVNHKDGDKQNNHPSNLEWVTQYENVKHANDMGLNKHAKGENVNTSILSNEQVHMICQLIKKYNGNIQNVLMNIKCKNGISDKKLCKIIGLIKNKICWRSISDIYFTDEFVKHKNQLSEDDIIKISKLIKKYDGDVDKIHSMLAQSQINVSKQYITNIKNKRILSNISDKYFTNDYHERLTDDEAILICEQLMKNQGDITKTYNTLKHDISKLTSKRIENIKYKISKTHISDRYFMKGYFKKDKVN